MFHYEDDGDCIMDGGEMIWVPDGEIISMGHMTRRRMTRRRRMTTDSSPLLVQVIQLPVSILNCAINRLLSEKSKMNTI
jgi:hypothetical protein